MIHLTPVERQLFDEAMDALGTQTRGAAKILRRPRGLLDPRFDAPMLKSSSNSRARKSGF